MVGEEIFNVEIVNEDIYVIGKWLSMLGCKKNGIELGTNDNTIAQEFCGDVCVCEGVVHSRACDIATTIKGGGVVCVWKDPSMC